MTGTSEMKLRFVCSMQIACKGYCEPLAQSLFHFFPEEKSFLLTLMRSSPARDIKRSSKAKRVNYIV